MSYPCDAGAKPRALRPTRDSSVRQTGNLRHNNQRHGTKMMPGIFAIGARHSEFEYR
jgi:hypothetical protein